jgi:hypothetical protein
VTQEDIARLIAKRETAEKVVEAMPNGTLKDKAFEVTFQYLLTAEQERPGRQTSRRRPSKASTPSPKTGGRRSRQGPGSQLRDLVSEGFFGQDRKLPEIVQELRVGGHHLAPKAVSTALQRLTQAKVLRRRQEKGERNRKVWIYTEY